MKTYEILIYLLILVLYPLYVFAETNSSSPAKVKECDFPENMNCFQNRNIADAEEINANFQALINQIKELTEILCSYNPNHRVCNNSAMIFRNNLGMSFRYIPAGTSMLGSPENEPGRYGDIEKIHAVTITRSFYMQTTEVTQKQWKQIMGSNPSNFSSCGNDCPVEMISWNDAQEFITKLNNTTNEHYRLPTEDEWEYAARAGSLTAFYNGIILNSDDNCNVDSNLDRIAWYCGNSGYKTHEVAQKIPNSWGLYDMLGNVYEWCQNRYENHVESSKSASDEVSYVLRGGAGKYFARSCRLANRRVDTSDQRLSYYGFRLVYVPNQ
jgi:formylglycine-generating enzyme required for sulfatase activity